MTSGAFERSRSASFSRPPPHLQAINGRRVYAPPEDCFPRGILDGDIIAGSTGTRIMVRQTDGSYVPDSAYENRGGALGRWRDTAMEALIALDIPGAEPAPIEFEANYERGASDVFPPDRRIQVDFDGEHSKITWMRAARTLRWHDIRITDDSSPTHERYKVFLTPRKLSKAHAVERIVARLGEELRAERERFSILAVGDSFPDLKMGLLGAMGADVTLLLVGGSRLATTLVDPDADAFAGENLTAIRQRLTPVGDTGWYHFRPVCGGGSRSLIVGDEAFPGTEAVGTVWTYLQSPK